MRKKILNNRKGFTLAEMLIALLITALAGLIALGGLTVAANSYKDILMKSQAQMVMKGYMDSIRSTLTNVSSDSGFQIRRETYNGETRVFFPNEKVNCAGYYSIKEINETIDGTDELIAKVLVFQHIDPTDYGTTDPGRRYSFDDVAEQTELIAARSTKGFAVEPVGFNYHNVETDAEYGAFTGALKLKSLDPLSNGQFLELEESFTIYPLNYH